MSTVLNIDTIPHDLADGRMLAVQPAAGAKASDVQITEHEQRLVADGHLLIIEADFDLSAIGEQSITAVLDWVGDDPDRAAEALAAEKARGDDARSTLIKKLDQEA